MPKKKQPIVSGLYNSIGYELDTSCPLIEMLSNRRVTVEGSCGVLLYESNNIKINTKKTVISFCGRGLTVKCISCSCVEIVGFITKVEFIT